MSKKSIGIGCLVVSICLCLSTCLALVLDFQSVIFFIQAPPFSEAWKMKNTANDFMQKIESGEQAQAFEYLTPKYQREVGSAEKLSAMFHGPISQVVLPYARLDDKDSSIGAVVGGFIDASGKKMALMLSFEKNEDGLWKISKVEADPIRKP